MTTKPRDIRRSLRCPFHYDRPNATVCSTKIINTEERKGLSIGKFFIFTIEVQNCCREWTVNRYYTDFISLHKILSSKFLEHDESFSSLFSTNLDNTLIEQHKSDLEKYLNHLLTSKQIQNCNEVTEFLMDSDTHYISLCNKVNSMTSRMEHMFILVKKMENRLNTQLSRYNILEELKHDVILRKIDNLTRTLSSICDEAVNITKIDPIVPKQKRYDDPQHNKENEISDTSSKVKRSLLTSSQSYDNLASLTPLEFEVKNLVSKHLITSEYEQKNNQNYTRPRSVSYDSADCFNVQKWYDWTEHQESIDDISSSLKNNYYSNTKKDCNNYDDSILNDKNDNDIPVTIESNTINEFMCEDFNDEIFQMDNNSVSKKDNEQNVISSEFELNDNHFREKTVEKNTLASEIHSEVKKAVIKFENKINEVKPLKNTTKKHKNKNKEKDICNDPTPNDTDDLKASNITKENLINNNKINTDLNNNDDDKIQSISPSIHPSISPSIHPSDNNIISLPQMLKIGGTIEISQNVNEILSLLAPTHSGITRLKLVFKYIEQLIKKQIGADIFPFGSFALNTFLPDSDLDVCVLLSETQKTFWVAKMMQTLSKEASRSNCQTSEEEVINTGNRQIDQLLSVKSIFYIKSNNVIKAQIGTTQVDMSVNRFNALASTCLFEEIDILIGKDHLFKKTLMLLKTWALHEVFILGSDKYLLSSYAFRVILATVLNFYSHLVNTPFQAFLLVLSYLKSFNWGVHGITINGPIRLSVLPTLEYVSHPCPDWPLGAAIITSSLIQKYTDDDNSPDDSKKYTENDDNNHDGSVTNNNECPRKHHYINIYDPLDFNNNLGKPVDFDRCQIIKKAFVEGFYSVSLSISKYSQSLLTPNTIINSMFKRSYKKYAHIKRKNDKQYSNSETIELNNPHIDMFLSDLYQLHSNWTHALEFRKPDFTGEELYRLVVSVLANHNDPVRIGKLGSLLHQTVKNHSLPYMIKEKFGGVKKFLEQYPDSFIIGNDHPYNPYISLVDDFEIHPEYRSHHNTTPDTLKSKSGHLRPNSFPINSSSKSIYIPNISQDEGYMISDSSNRSGSFSNTPLSTSYSPSQTYKYHHSPQSSQYHSPHHHSPHHHSPQCQSQSQPQIYSSLQNRIRRRRESAPVSSSVDFALSHTQTQNSTNSFFHPSYDEFPVLSHSPGSLINSSPNKGKKLVSLNPKSRGAALNLKVYK